MKKIKLVGKFGKGKFTLVDDEDFAYFNQWKWHCDSNYYVIRGAIKKEGKYGSKIRMTRVIMKTPSNLQVDHINHNPLDNRKENLRNCTPKENNRNKRPAGGTGFKGVCWHKLEKKYQVSLRINGVKKYFGYHIDIIKAAKIYDREAKKYYGEFAYLNFPKPR